MFYGSSLNINKSTLKFNAFKYAEIKVKLPKYSNQLARSNLVLYKFSMKTYFYRQLSVIIYI